VASRCYQPSVFTAAPVTPVNSSLWHDGTNAKPPVLMQFAKQGSAFATTTVAETGGSNVRHRNTRMVTMVSAPLAAQTISGTFRGQLLLWESNGAADLIPQATVYVVNTAGTSILSTLYAGDTRTTSIDEAPIAIGNVPCPGAAISPVTLTSFAVPDGARLVIQYGFRANNTSTTNFFMLIGLCL
jgi:hypothetical protein